MLKAICLCMLVLISILGIIRFRQLDISVRIISILLIYTAVHEYFAQVPLYKDFRIYWLYGGLSAALYVLAFRSMLVKKRQKALLLSFAIAYASVGIVKFLSAASKFPSYFILTSILIIVFSAILGLYSLLEKSDDRPLYKNPDFLLAASIIVYQCTFFTYLGYYNTVMSSIGMNPFIVDLHICFSILYYLCFGIAFCLPQKRVIPPLNALHL